MNAPDTLSMSWSNLRRRKGRTVLTLAGVVIGVAALVLMVSLGLGLQRQFLKLFQTEESLRTLSVMRVKSESDEKDSGGLAALLGMGGQFLPITEKDLAEIRTIPGVALALPDFNMFLRVSMELPEGQQKRWAFEVGGASPDEPKRYSGALVAGKLWSGPEARECLLPSGFLEHFKLAPAQALGSRVRFEALVGGDSQADAEEPYTAVGVLDSKKLGLLGNRIYLPMARALELYEAKGSNPMMAARKGAFLQAEVRLADPGAAEAVENRLQNSGYTVISPKSLIQSINLIFLILEGVLACVGVIGLIVSLFGIANTMAMAVLERTREIGIMKALGARDRDIGRLFLAEAAAIGALGGITGLALGAGTGKLLNLLARGLFKLESDVSLFHVSVWLAAGSVVFSISVSVLAGWIPARRAARMEPVSALRFE